MGNELRPKREQTERRPQYERKAIRALMVSMGGVNYTTALREYLRIEQEIKYIPSQE